MLSGSRWCDRLVTLAVVAVVGVAPLLFGGVHRPAFTNLEALVLAGIAGWLAKIWHERPAPVRLRIPLGECTRLALPVLALTAVSLLELVPFPPRILRVIAPATYRIYRISFPGWPAFSPYQTLAPIWTIKGVAAVPRTTTGQVPAAGGQPSLAEQSARARSGESAALARPALPGGREAALPIPPLALRLHWQTLSLAPSATRDALLAWFVLAGLFFLIMLYPLGLPGETAAELRFYRAVVIGVLTTAVVVATLGLLERAWWNGRLLWFYVPEDWGGPLPMIVPRASGPFVDPDHFANYLAMVLPVGLALAIAPPAIVERGQRANLQLFAALASVTIVAGLLLSFSRAGWAAAIAGVVTTLTLGARHTPSLVPAPLRTSRRLAALGVSAALAGGLAVVLLVAGPLGRTQVADRVISVVTNGDDVHFRPAVWRDTMNMIADFPVFGVGLGAWPEVFPHYQRPPWIPFFFRAAENDYVQLMAETGLAGMLALAWLAVALIRALRRGSRHLPERQWPWLAGLAGGVVAALVHEGFDFALHTPANALLFTVLLALAVRIALVEGLAAAVPTIRLAPRVARAPYLLAPLGTLVIGGLLAAVYLQDGGAYPYRVLVEENLRRAELNLITHPAMSAAHLRLAQLVGAGAPGEIRVALLRAAVWLDPNDPASRDRYAQALLMAGARAPGFAEVTRAVFHAPHRMAHPYLAPELTPWLLPAEQEAIRAGFERAIASGFDGATDELAEFYRELGRYRDVAELYSQAARAATDPAVRVTDEIEAGRAHGLLGDANAAAAVLEAAASVAPTDSRPYAELARSVFGPLGKMAAARAAIEQGLRAGADPYALYLALADAAEQAKDRPAVEAALEQALQHRNVVGLATRLGELYLADRQFDQAVRIMSQATAMSPGSATAWFELGEADEGAYDYYAASQAYARATALAPADRSIRAVYTDFQRRTAAGRPAGGTPTDSAAGLAPPLAIQPPVRGP